MHCSLSCIISYIEDGDWWRAYMIVMWCTISQRMVTCIVNVHPWLWCCPARHVCLSYGESANDSLSLVTNRITPKTEKPLQTNTHTLTHTNTPHTHSLTFPYIYRRFFEQRRHYCHRYLFRVLCGQCYCYQFHYSLRFLHDLRSRKVAIQLTSSHQCLTLHLHLQPRWPGSIGGRPERAH